MQIPALLYGEYAEVRKGCRRALNAAAWRTGAKIIYHWPRGSGRQSHE
ncbi:MAG: hypothetical protein JWO59_2198 [Chloroflexi bacterium]|nr:hypothetical protein [Chloroflexota bacterium]